MEAAGGACAQPGTAMPRLALSQLVTVVLPSWETDPGAEQLTGRREAWGLGAERPPQGSGPARAAAGLHLVSSSRPPGLSELFLSCQMRTIMHLPPPRAHEAQRQALGGPHKRGCPSFWARTPGSTISKAKAESTGEVQVQPGPVSLTAYFVDQRPESSCLFNRGKSEFTSIP